MVSILEMDTEDPRAATAGTPNSDPLTQQLYGSGAAPVRYDSQNYYNQSDIGETMKSRMPELVKGAGMAFKGGNQPLTNYSDIMTRSAQAALDIRMATKSGFTNKAAVVGSMNQRWLDERGAFKTALLQMSPMDYISGLVSQMPGGQDAIKSFAAKSFTAGNLGIGSVYGLVPSLGGFVG